MMIINGSLIVPSAINAGAHNGNRLPDDPYELMCSNSINIHYDFTILICIFGILLNGMVIWILGFCVEKSPFTIYILNLAVADFGILVAAIMFRIKYCAVKVSSELDILVNFLYNKFLCMFSISQMFLTVISVDRCVSVFFPLWHQCHQPTRLFTLVCPLVWILSYLTGITASIAYGARTYFSPKVVIYLFIANGFLCIPLMTISSLMLFLKVCCKTRQQRRQKLLTAILIIVAFFLFCCFPFNTFMFMVFLNQAPSHFLFGATSFVCLKSSINPLIYYLVGRRKEGRSNKGMKGILQNLFKEEEI